MATMAFDSLRYTRRLREVGVPEPQAEAQAELMAEAFGFYAENILTRDHFTDVINARFAEQDAKLEALETKIDKRFIEQDAKFDRRFAEQDAKFDKRFAEQDAKFDKRFGEQELNLERRFSSIDQRFARQDRTLSLHTWMLGLLVIVLVIPQLQAWLT